MKQVNLAKVVTITTKDTEIVAAINPFRTLESVIQNSGINPSDIESTSVSKVMPTAIAMRIVSQKMGTNVINARVFGDHGENYHTMVHIG